MAAPHPPSHATLNPAPEPPAVSAAMARAHQTYWRFNLALIATLMTLGFLVSFVLPLAAPALTGMHIGGFQLPFYFGAQGAILIYVALIVVYIVLMQHADRRLMRAFDADASAALAADVDAASSVATNDATNTTANTTPSTISPARRN